MSRATELLEQATVPPPWIRPWGAYNVRGIGSADVLANQANLDLAVYAVNRLPDYEAAVEALTTIEQFLRPSVPRRGDGQEGRRWGDVNVAHAKAREALARLREKVPA